MNTLESVSSVEKLQGNKKDESKYEQGASFEVEKSHQDPKFYEVHKHIENLLAYISRPKITEEQEENILALRNRLENCFSLVGVEADIEYGQLSVLQSNEANALSKNLNTNIGLNDREVEEKIKDIDIHIDNGEKLRRLKSRIEEFYEKSDENIKEKFESVIKSVEHIMLKTNALIIHIFLFDERRDDDLDIISALKPSLLTSSVVVGTKQGLPKGKSGVVLSGGDVRGIEENGGTNIITNYKEIYEKISSTDERPYNEIIIENPEIFGFFLNVSVDDNGELYDFKTSIIEDARRFKEDFMRNMNFARSRGFPQLVMTPDRRMFEFISINDNGIVNIGEEITSEKIAKRKVDLSVEKRKELSRVIMSRSLNIEQSVSVVK